MRRVLEAVNADSTFVEHRDEVYAQRDERIPEALELLRKLRQELDLEGFRQAMEEWSRKPGFDSFGGFNGQMFLNQLVKRAVGDEAGVASLIAETMSLPVDEAEARTKLQTFTDHVEGVRKGSHPAPGRVPFFVSFFWALQDEDSWPAIWNSAEDMLKALGWLTSRSDAPDRYLEFHRRFLEAAIEGARRTESAFFWLDQHRFVGLDVAGTVR